MTLNDLINVFDNDTTFQICKEDSWEDYDTVLFGSKLLNSIKHLKVRCAEAIECDVVRVDLEWSGLNE